MLFIKLTKTVDFMTPALHIHTQANQWKAFPEMQDIISKDVTRFTAFGCNRNYVWNRIFKKHV